MSGEVGALLAAAKEAERRCRRYNRVIDVLDKLTLALYIPASVVTTVGLVAGLAELGADPVKASLEGAVEEYAEVLRLDVPVGGGKTLGDLL